MAKKKLLTEDEKRRRRHLRRAEAKNAKDLAAMPLFVEQLPHRTAEREFWHWRFNVAYHAGERCSTFIGNRILSDLRENAIRRYVRQVVGEAFEGLDAHRFRTHPSTGDYGCCFWERVLTGERIVFGMKLRENRQPGESCTVDTDWYEHRHMSREEYWSLFPYKENEPLDHPAAVDPLGLGVNQT